MPTINIWSNLQTAVGQQRFSRDITAVVVRNGLDARRILVCWQFQSLAGVFLGPLRVASRDRCAGSTLFCRLSVEIDESRDGAWRRKLLRDLLELAEQYFTEGMIFISLVPVSPSNYLNVALAAEPPAPHRTLEAEP